MENWPAPSQNGGPARAGWERTANLAGAREERRLGQEPSPAPPHPLPGQWAGTRARGSGFNEEMLLP